ncbi:MAG TPA: aldo/keto reductase, partial [Hanamia sp.]|nr:aldo/keto reductase [Hanamia sp.]
NLDLVKKIESIAQEKNCTPAQLALAWVMAQSEHIFPIPGTKKVKYVEENAEATEINLSEKDLREIEQVFPENAASGLRYTEAGMKTLNL